MKPATLTELREAVEADTEGRWNALGVLEAVERLASISQPDERAEWLSGKLDSANERIEWLERARQAEYGARIKAEQKLKSLEEKVSALEAQADADARNHVLLSRCLSHAEGFIAALQNKPYPFPGKSDVCRLEEHGAKMDWRINPFTQGDRNGLD